MAQILKMRPLDVLRKANQEKTIKEEFEIPLANGESIKAVLTVPDLFMIMKDQERCYQREYAICLRDGMGGLPINEDDWQKDLERIKDLEARKTLAKDKPKNLAEQVAQKNSRFDTIRTLLPKILRDEKGELFCNTYEEQQELSTFITNDPNLMSLLTEKYVSLMNRYTEIGKVAKNSPKRGNSGSKSPSQGNSDTEAPSIQNS